MVGLVRGADEDEGAGCLGVATLADVCPPRRVVLDPLRRALLVGHAMDDEPLCRGGYLLMRLEAGVLQRVVVGQGAESVGVATCQELHLFRDRHDPQQVGHGDDGSGWWGRKDGSEATVFHQDHGA